MRPDIGMKLSAVLAFGTNGASGINCYSDEDHARSIIADQATDPFRATLKTLEERAIKAAEAAHIAARDRLEDAAALQEAAEATQDEVAAELAALRVQIEAAIAARWSTIVAIGGIWIDWPDRLGPFPSEAVIDGWEAASDKAAARRRIESESGLLNADMRAIAIASLPAGHPTRTKAEAVEAQLAAI